MKRSIFALLLLTALGCGGDDANAPATDAATSDVMARTCDGRAYDLCSDTTANTDCMAGLTCRFYMQQNFTICSPTCDASTPCPDDENGNPVSCNQMGRCRSSAPNTCTP